jgi:general secretion pathway protein F
MIGFIFVVVIPKITKIFISMKKTLPLQTQLCIWISNFLLNYWWAVLAAIIGGYITFSKYIKTKAGKRQWDGFLLKAPIVGELVVMINASRFCSTLATLLTSGVPILTAMKIVKNLISNELMRDAVEEARDNISQGASMTGPLIKSGHFPSMMTHMIKLGERSGEIEPMLKIVSENYEDEVNTKLGGLTSTLEPIMMIVMGMAVAFIVFSVVVPMMELNKLK